MSVNSAATPTSTTPILDRLEPIPVLKAPGSGARERIWLGLMIIAAAAFGFFYGPSRGSLLQQLEAKLPDQWTGAKVVSAGLMALLIAVAVVAVHEIGHVLGGLCAGFRFNGLRIGPLMIHRGFRFSLVRGLGAWLGGSAHMVPDSTDRLTARALVLVCAGPAASIIVGCAVLLLPEKGLAALAFGLASLAGGLGELVPCRVGNVVSDGARIGMLLRNGGQGERWLALLRLAAELGECVPPESLSAEYVAKAIAVQDVSPDTVTAHAIAYMAAYWRHQDVEAGRLLETCLRFSSAVGPAMLAALISDVAVFQARKRQRPDLAEEWLAAMPTASASAPSLLLSRAVAAVLEARGDIAGCLLKLEEYEQAIRALPAAGQRTMLLRGLLRWRAELREATALP